MSRKSPTTTFNLGGHFLYSLAAIVVVGLSYILLRFPHLVGTSFDAAQLSINHLLANMTTIPPPSQPTHSEHHLKTTPQFLLFGDSITQSSQSDLIPALSALYSRRLDVVNRGFSGYTTVAALPLLPSIFPIHPSPPAIPQVKLMTVFFGANDATTPGNQQHVPLETYTAALHKILAWPAITHHNTKVLLLTPPPVDEHQLRLNEGPNTSRRAAITKQYADAARNVALSAGTPNVALVDVWALLMSEAGFCPPPSSLPAGTTLAASAPTGSAQPYLPGDARAPTNAALARLLSDGLHFTAEGYALVYGEIERVIRQELPECAPEEMEMVYPDWSAVVGNPGWEKPGSEGEGRL